MKKFDKLIAQATSLPDDNIDTDIIYPARFLLITSKKGLGSHAFTDRIAAGDDRIGEGRVFPILCTGQNFGCGSSREHAVWALANIGVQAIFAPSYGEIFRGNCVNNGIVAGQVTQADMPNLHAGAKSGATLRVDLIHRTISGPFGSIDFSIPDADRETLLNGWNETTRILALHKQDISTFEQQQRTSAPWLWTHEYQQELPQND